MEKLNCNLISMAINVSKRTEWKRVTALDMRIGRQRLTCIVPALKLIRQIMFKRFEGSSSKSKEKTSRIYKDCTVFLWCLEWFGPRTDPFATVDLKDSDLIPSHSCSYPHDIIYTCPIISKLYPNTCTMQIFTVIKTKLGLNMFARFTSPMARSHGWNVSIGTISTFGSIFPGRNGI